MKLRHKFYGFTGAVYVAVIGTAVFQYEYGNYRADKQRAAGDFAVDHMRADMAHDAIRSDVYAFLRGEELGRSKEAKEAAQDLLTHTGALTDVLKTESSVPNLEAALKAAVVHTGAEAERYVQAAGAVISATPERRSEALTRFNELFRLMETAMEDVGDKAEKSALQADEAIRRGAMMFYAAAAASLLALAAGPLLANRALFRPLQALSLTMRRYADRDYDAPCFGVGREDEIGEMAEVLLAFKTNGLERMRLQREAAELAAKAEADRRRQLAEVAEALEAEIKGAVTSLSDSARALSGASAEMSATVTVGYGLTTRAEQAASGAACNVSAVSAAADQLNASVHEISGQVHRADQLARLSQESAEHARRAVSGLSEATEKVEGVMESIGRIAAQINLLALNAGVESVRAGESGKGFAVVAGEVKNLAAQTDRSIREIKTVITKMMTSSVEIREAVEAILESAGSISSAATGVSVAVAQQTTVTEDVAKNMRAAAFSVRTVSEGLTEAGMVSQRADKAAMVIAESAGALSAKAGELEGRTTLFLKKLLAA